MNESGSPVLVNVGHDRTKVIGHVLAVRQTPEGAEIRARIVDTTQLAYEACEFIHAGTFPALSIEFVGVPSTINVSRDAEGRQLITHRAVVLHGAAVVPAPAYRSAGSAHS